MRLLLAIFCSLLLIACDSIPEEGTIVYDLDHPRADEVPTGGSGSGGGGGGTGTGTTGSGSGSGGYDPDNSSIGYTITESGGSTDVVEGATDTFDIVLNSAPTDNITITITTPNTGDILISSGGGALSPDNTTLTLTFTPSNWNTPQSVTVTGVEDATDEGGGTTAVNLTVSVTQSLDPDWVPADIPDSTITANLTDSQATGPPSSITDLAAVAGSQQNTLSWTAASGVSSYLLYWSTSSPVTTGDNSIAIDGSDTSYVHGGLTADTPYYYAIEPINGFGSAGLSNEVSGTPSSFTGCTTTGTLSDPDADLLVHYDFNGNLNDTKNAYGDGRYNLTNTGGAIKFAQGCGYGNAAYFDPSAGYAYNDNFTDANEPTLTGNFTITMWLNGDDDNEFKSALYSSGRKNVDSSHQLYVDESNRLSIESNNNGSGKGFGDSNPIINGQWYHVAAVHDDQNNWTLYKNGVSVATDVAGATWEQLRIGINRKKQITWKGYIDEFKVFGRAFTADNVTDACLLYEECEKYVAPKTPTGLTATDPNNGTSINLTWNAVNGADNYTVYWTSNPAVPIDPSDPSTYDGSTTVTGTSATATGLTNGTSYDFTVVATNTAGNSSPAAEVNATPTLVLPAAMDNVTAYYGFYQNYFAGGYHNMPPAYAVTWNPHPDFASGDSYRVFYSDNLSQPIDPTDSSTYLGVTSSTEHYALIQTRPFYTVDNVTYNDGFLENTPLRFAVTFRDQSKGDLYSPVVELTPTMAGEAHREWGDLRISNGFFKDGDNSTLYSFGRSNGSLPLRIEHKDIVNVGERVIFDGSWLRSDVFPEMVQNNSGYNYMYLQWYSPTRMRSIGSDGNRFTRSSGSGWRLEANYATPNGRCGTGNAEDCDWAMEISAEDTVGLIVNNSNGRRWNGTITVYDGTGTLDGPTDYAAVSGSDHFAGNGLYTSEQTGSHSQIDNASYAGFRMHSTNSVFQINLANADAAIRKVAIPITPPTNLAGTTPADTQQVNLTWDKSTDSLRDSHVIYWKKDGCGFSCVTIDPDDNSTYDGRIVTGRNTESYVHGGLDGGSYYHYVIRAETNVGGVSTIEPVPPAVAFSAQTNSFPGGGPINPDGDADLVVYYDFNDSGGGNFLENKAPNTTGSYNLTAAGSEIIPAGSIFSGNTAAYFDASEGYAYANDVNQTNIPELSNTGNFTISVWVYPDQDMTNFSSVMSTADGTNKGTGGFQISQTSSNPDPNKIGMYAQNTDLKLEGPAILDNTWYHVVFTKEQNGLDDGTGTFYVDGVQEDQLTDFKTGWIKLKVGINRVTQNNWKGYIDEFKIYKRALTGAEVTNLYNNGTP